MNRKSSAAPVSKPSLPVLQMDATGGLDAQRVADVQNYINSPEAKAQAIAPTLAERLFGRDITTDTQTIDPETNAVTMETKSLHQPGYLEQAGAGLKRGINDLLGGYNENRTQNFSVDNWNNNYLDNGNKKGLVYRLGEGLGSFAKLAESPIGRSLLVGGIVGATGGDGLQALTYGAQTGMMNQQNRAKDQMYRKALAERKIDTSGIRGYIGDDMFKSILEDAQLRDNAEYRNAMLQTQVNNQREMMEYRKQEAERQARQDQQDNYFRGQQIAQGWEKLKNDKENRGNVKFSEISSMRKEFSGIPAIKNFNEIQRQYNQVTNTYNAYKSGKLRANAADQTMVTTLNKILDPDSVVRESEFARTAAGQSLLARMEGYANKMTKGGGGLTEAEREDLYIAMQEMYKANEDEANAYIQSYTDLANRYGINPADIMPRQYYQKEEASNVGGQTYPEGTVIKNKQGQKMIMRGGQWQAM